MIKKNGCCSGGINKTGCSETPEEKAERLDVPLIPEREPSCPNNDSNPTVGVCGKCGMELKKVMGYVCPCHDCPCQEKISC